MKFGKELKERSVRGWEEHYMSYKRFKRIIKKLVVQQKEREELLQQHHQHSPSADDNDDAASVLSHPPHSSDDDEGGGGGGREWEEQMILQRDARKEFFEELEKEIERVNDFFVAQLDEMNAECSRLLAYAGGGLMAEARRQPSSRSLLTPSSSTPTSASSPLSVSFPASSSSSFTSRILAPLSSPLRLPSTPFLQRSITVSAQSQLEQRSENILSLYRQYLNLLSFSFVNQQGFIKAMKKYDKVNPSRPAPAHHPHE